MRRMESFSEGGFLPVFLGRDQNNIRAWRCIWIAHGSLARSRKRARSYSACEGPGFFRWYMCESLSDESLSFSWLGGLSLAHNKHGSKSPDEAHGPGERSGPRKMCVSRRCEHDQTHTRRRCCASRRPVESYARRDICPFTAALRQDGGCYIPDVWRMHGFGRSLSCGLEAFQISRSLRIRITLERRSISTTRYLTVPLRFCYDLVRDIPEV